MLECPILHWILLALQIINKCAILHLILVQLLLVLHWFVREVEFVLICFVLINFVLNRSFWMIPERVERHCVDLTLVNAPSGRYLLLTELPVLAFALASTVPWLQVVAFLRVLCVHRVINDGVLDAFVCAAEFGALELFKLKFGLVSPDRLLAFRLCNHLVTYACNVRNKSRYLLISNYSKLL